MLYVVELISSSFIILTQGSSQYMIHKGIGSPNNMPSAIAAATRIFEDTDADAKATRAMKSHKRTPSVGEFLRGRRNRENDQAKLRANSPATRVSETPLGERQINSPPQARQVPVKDATARPTMYKKTKSNISIKSFVKDKSSDSGSMSSADGRVDNPQPKKSKSSTNLAALFKRKSKKNLRDEASKGQENVSPPSSANVETPRSPIWAQFATQPLEDQRGKVHYPPGKRRTVQEEIELYTPRNLATYRPPQLSGHHETPALAEKPPQRPFLEHKSSRSSVFKEDLGDDDDGRPDQKPLESSPSKEVRPQLQPKSSHCSQPPETNGKRSSRVLAAIDTLNLKSQKQASSTPKNQENPSPLNEEEIDCALEALLDARNIAPNMRSQMRGLDTSMKLKLIQNQRGGSGSSTSSQTLITTDKDRTDQRSSRPTTRDEEDAKEAKRSRSRPRSRAFTLTKRDEAASPTKKQKGEESTRARSKSRPKSVDMSSMRPSSSRSLKSSTSISSLFSSNKPDAAAVPGDFIHYLREVERPELVEIGKMHKLRILLRNESIAWTDTFVRSGGMDEVINLLYRVIRVEWREEHEDNLLHETLLCLKGLCTTSLALERLAEIEAELFPRLLGMLFDEEKKGPSEFSTRSIVISLLFAHLSAARHTDGRRLASRARTILNYLKDPSPEEAKKPFDFIEQMHVNRPYRIWCKEVVNVTKEVFWIFLHHLNVIPIINSNNNTPPDHLDHGHPSKTFTNRHYPPPRPPHPAAPYVGGVEWEATSYLAIHLDLLNGLLASLPGRGERNSLREEMRASGWEKAMGGTMRTCKEKFYGGVHEGLKVWVAAAKEDGWAVEDVRAGPPRDNPSPKKGNSPVKKREEAPKLRLDVGVPVAVGGEGVGLGVDGWDLR